MRQCAAHRERRTGRVWKGGGKIRRYATRFNPLSATEWVRERARRRAGEKQGTERRGGTIKRSSKVVVGTR
jgi:hypothetical protein